MLESGKELESHEKDKRKGAERNRFYSSERAMRTTATTTKGWIKKKWKRKETEWKSSIKLSVLNVSQSQSLSWNISARKWMKIVERQNEWMNEWLDEKKHNSLLYYADKFKLGYSCHLSIPFSLQIKLWKFSLLPTTSHTCQTLFPI